MRVRTKIGLLLVALIPTLGWGACTEKTSENKVHMEQVQDHVGHCGPFAFRALYHHYVCENQPELCNLPSVTHFFMGMKDQREYQGRIDELYQKLVNELNEGGVYGEDCLKFTDLFPKDQVPDGPVSWGQNFSFHYRTFFMNYTSKSYDPETKCISRNFFATRPITPEELSKIKLNDGIINEILEYEIDRLSKTNQCKKAKPKPFKLVRKEITDSVNSIKEGLDKGPLFLGLKVIQPDGSSSGNHAVVVTNYKETCCFGTCQTKYQLLDSLGFYWSKTHKDGWISEKELIEVMNSSKYTQLEPK